ncbi:MAG: hypothetical protein ACON4P_07840 [Candidatus Puniceispirillales bacterium]
MASIIVTGGDEYFGAMTVDCVMSARAQGYDGRIAVLDFGYADETREQIIAAGGEMHRISLPPPFDAIDFRGPSGALVLMAKPYLPDLFPGHDLYVFVDADCWFQTRTGLDALLDHGDEADLCAVSQRSRFHDWDVARGNGVEFNMLGQPLRRNWYTMFANSSSLPRADKKRLAEVPIINAGVFAAGANSPLWQYWREEMYRCVEALPQRRKLGADQLGLGLAVYRHDLSTVLLPEICNWTSVFRYDEDTHLFTETQPFHAPVGIMHLAGIGADNTIRPVTMAAGGTKPIDLTWRAWMQRKAGASAS